MEQADSRSWPESIFRTLIDHRIRQVAYVPDAGHKQLIEICRGSDDVIAVPLTTEEEGVALLAGAWLGGERGVLLMQSSGVGNCINMFSLTRVCRMPLLLLVTMRGEDGEQNPWQVPMGRNTEQLLGTAGLQVFRVDDSARLGPTVDETAAMVYREEAAAAVLISQRLLGVKSFER